MDNHELDILDNWWALPKGDLDLSKKFYQTVSEIEENQALVRNSWERYARYYSNREEFGLSWEVTGGNDAFESLVTNNIVKQVVDTAASIVAKNRVKPRLMTNGGDWSVQRKAIKLEAWNYGEQKFNDVWEMGPEMFRAGVLFGTGCFKVIPKKGKGVKLNHILIPEIVVDERACPNGNPREIFHRTLVDKYTLAAKYPKFRDEIFNSESENSFGGKSVPPNMVVLIEGHRLPDESGANGRHIIAVEHAVLHDKVWKHNWFPYVFFRWDGKPISGFYGMSGARQIMGIQERITQLYNFIQVCQDRIAVPRIFVDAGAKVMKLQINNEIGGIIPYRGKPPVFMTAEAVSAEIYRHLDQLEQKGFATFGLLDSRGQGAPPPGVDSAVGIREHNDLGAQRFIINSQRYERFFIDLTRCMIQVAKAFVYKGSDKVQFKDRMTQVDVPWADVDLEDDKYILDIEPASILSQSPAARLQAVTELAQVGQLDKAEVRRLLDHPDLRHSSDVANADFDTCLRVEGSLLDGKFIPPEEFMNLELMLRRMPLVANKAANDGAPPEILSLFRTWVAQAQGLMGIGQPAAAPPAGAPPVDPATGQPVNPALSAGSTPIASGSAGSDVIQNLAGPIVA